MTTSAEHVNPDWRTTREEEAPSALGAFFRSISLGFGALNLFGEETPVVEVDKPARGLPEEDGLKGYRPESPEDDLERYHSAGTQHHGSADELTPVGAAHCDRHGLARRGGCHPQDAPVVDRCGGQGAGARATVLGEGTRAPPTEAQRFGAEESAASGVD